MCRLRKNEVRIDEPYATLINHLISTGGIPPNTEPATKAHLTRIINENPLIETKIIPKAKPTTTTSKYTIYQLLCLWLFLVSYASITIGIIYA